MEETKTKKFIQNEKYEKVCERKYECKLAKYIQIKLDFQP